MVAMPETWVSLLGALMGGPIAWRSPRELAEALGRDEGDTTDLLASMDEDGWLGVWEIDGEVFVTLSALGAERLGVRLVESAEDHAPRWSPRGNPEPPTPRARNVCTLARAADLAFVIDPSPSPDLAAQRTEAVARRALAPDATDNLPWPTLLLGQGLTPWPGPGRDPLAPCPACRSAALRPHVYCLCCDRWGLDDKLSAGSEGRPSQHQARRQGPPSEQADGVAQRARRKSRRRRKLEARNVVDRQRDPRRPTGAKGHGREGTPLA